MVRRRSNKKRRLQQKAIANADEPPDPITILAITGVALGAAGTTFGAIGAKQSANASAALQQSNAYAAERDAAFARDKAKYDETLSRQRAERIRGQQRAAIGASGLDFAGSPLDLLEETAVQSEIEALNIRAMGELSAGGSEFAAGASRLQANAYRRQGTSQLTSGLMSTGGQLAGGLATTKANYDIRKTGTY